jgi:hypothetical protein
LVGQTDTNDESENHGSETDVANKSK